MGKQKFVKVLKPLLLICFITTLITSLIFISKSSEESLGEKSHLRNHSNILSPVRVSNAKANQVNLWELRKDSLKYKYLSENFPINYNAPFPTAGNNTRIQAFAIPLSVPLQIRICASQHSLKSGLFYIEQVKSKFTFAQLVGYHRVELTEIEKDSNCEISRTLTLIESTNSVFGLKKIAEIAPGDAPFHFSKSKEYLFVVTKTGLLRKIDAQGRIAMTKALFDTHLFSGSKFANLGVKSTHLRSDKLYVVAAIVENRCGFITVTEFSLEKNTQNEIFRSECYRDDRESNTSFWTDMNGSGGRITDSSTRKVNLFLSVGQAEIWQGSEPQTVNQGLGILLDLNPTTRQIKLISRGHRNIQGICSINGRILASEQGPQGGDELNWIVENGNYGWPYESYGRPYGVGVNFPNDRKFGQHENPKFIKPIFAWLPSIAIGDLACPKFVKNVSDYFILAATLKDQSLHLVRFSGSFVLYDERIFLGERIRDIDFDFETSTGYFSTDTGNIYEFAMSPF